MNFKLELGTQVKDRITDFEGIVTGRCEYVTGCRQYCITPKVNKDGNIRDSVWLDEDRLLTKVSETKNNGGPQDCLPPVK